MGFGEPPEITRAPRATMVATVSGQVANYRSIPSKSGNVPLGQLPQGTPITVIGYTLTAANEPKWYQFERDGQRVWIAASLVAPPPEGVPAKLPFVPASDIPNPGHVRLAIVDDAAEALLRGVGVRLADGEAVDLPFATRLVGTLEACHAALAGTWTAADLAAVEQIFARCAECAVTPSCRSGSAWKLAELMLVDDAVARVAGRTRQLFEARFGGTIQDAAMPFRLLYGPLRIYRVTRRNVNPNPPNATGHLPVWWAINRNGFEVDFGNFVFSGVSRKFKLVDLVVHEICHNINWRYRAGTASPESVYQPRGTVQLTASESGTGSPETVHFTAIDQGYTTRPRSSNEPWEVVTDAITNDAVDGYTDDLMGRARRKMVEELLFQVIDFRVHTYGSARPHVRSTEVDLEVRRLAEALRLLELHEAADLAFLQGL